METPKARLLGNTALLQQWQNDRTAGGILLALKYAREDRKQWIVIGTGPGKRLKNGTVVPPDVKRGDKCLYDAGVHGNLHDAGPGLIIVDADKIEAVWT